MDKVNIISYKPNKRLESLDILRGFDMFWIVGGGVLIRSMAEGSGWNWLKPIAEQMAHVDWAGFHLYDLIMPLFMFCAGVAIPFSILSRVENGVARTSLLQKIIKRGIILIILGVIYNGALKGEFVNIKYTSILGHIGLTYMIAASICLYTSSFRKRVFWVAGIFAFIAFVQLVVPLLGWGVTPISVPYSSNMVKAIIDRAIIPGVFTYETWDSHGILGAVSASSVMLIGSLAGSILRDGKPADTKKTLILVYTGIGLLLVGIALSPFYPVIRRAWTVTLNLVTTGISFLLLSIIYYCIDVREWEKGIFAPVAFFFKIIGLNAITIFFINQFIDFNYTSRFLLGWLEFFWGGWVIILGAIILKWLFVWFLYKKKIFLRV